MQDNYSWCGPSQVRGTVGIANYEWKVVQGGDGFVAIQDPNDYRIAYSESQDGNMVRIDRVTGETISIRPQPASGEPAIRWRSEERRVGKECRSRWSRRRDNRKG